MDVSGAVHQGLPPRHLLPQAAAPHPDGGSDEEPEEVLPEQPGVADYECCQFRCQHPADLDLGGACTDQRPWWKTSSMESTVLDGRACRPWPGKHGTIRGHALWSLGSMPKGLVLVLDTKALNSMVSVLV
jgi:hypothetical protein